MDPNSTRVILATAPEEAAPALARKLLEARVAACVNLLPGATSVYRWEGRVEEVRETLMIMKTAADRVGALQDRLAELHPYDVPEFLVLPVESGLEAYLAWVRDETRERSE